MTTACAFLSDQLKALPREMFLAFDLATAGRVSFRVLDTCMLHRAVLQHVQQGFH